MSVRALCAKSSVVVCVFYHALTYGAVASCDALRTSNHRSAFQENPPHSQMEEYYLSVIMMLFTKAEPLLAHSASSWHVTALLECN